MRRDGRWLLWCVAIGAVALFGINSIAPANNWVGRAEDANSATALEALDGSARRGYELTRQEMMRSISSRLSSPRTTRRMARGAKRVHALFDGEALDLGARRAVEDEPADPLGDRHDLEDRQPAAVAGVRGTPGSRPRGGPWRRRGARRSAPSSRSCSSSAASAGSAQCSHSLRASRCAATSVSADATRYGSTPISIRRIGAAAARVACSVDSTRWPVIDASAAMRAVSVSRTSPMNTMSGSARSIDGSVVGNVSPTRGLIWICLMPSSRNSTGSSTETMLLDAGVDLREHRVDRRRLARTGRARR